MTVLKELSEEYNKLDESDVKRTNLLNSVGGKLRATQLDALLRQWDTYEKMLQEFEDGSGSMAQEAEKTANSWDGSINRLSNSWTKFVQNFIKSDTVIGGIQTLNASLNVLGTVLSPIGSVLNFILTAFDGLIPKLTLLNVGVAQLPKLFNKIKDLKLVGRRKKIRLKVCPLQSTGNCERVKNEYGVLNKGLYRKQLKWCA